MLLSVSFGAASALLCSYALAAALGPEGAGDPAAALRALYDACSGKVMAAALRLLGDRGEAEDVVQETFLELWRRAAEYDPARASAETWAVVIGRSRALDRLRARAAARRTAAGYAAEPARQEASPAVEAGQASARVRAALAGLPADQREAIELAYFEGLSQSEIAGRTRQPLGTVKTRVRLGMQKLAAVLQESPP
jgi:RNA polymerase sigma-70 factor (ECF subfamily)